MITKTEYIFTEEDKELLKKGLPENPCDNCDAGRSCCGCQKERDYQKISQPFKDANIYDIALSVRRHAFLANQVQIMRKEMQTINEALPDFIKFNKEENI